MNEQEAIKLALEVCNYADMIEIKCHKGKTFIEWIFYRPQLSMHVGKIIDEKFDIRAAKNDLWTMHLHSNYNWN